MQAITRPSAIGSLMGLPAGRQFNAELPGPTTSPTGGPRRHPSADGRPQHRGTTAAATRRRPRFGWLRQGALDRRAAIPARPGVRNALINIGGNVLALGNKGERPGGSASSIRS